MKRRKYVLDSYAVLAYLQAERGGAKVKDLLKEAKASDVQILLSVINLGEVLYVIERKLGYETAMNTLKDILRLPIQVAEVPLERVLAAAHIKAQYAIAYADTFAVALAQELEATIVTADPEFKRVESLVDILWLLGKDG